MATLEQEQQTRESLEANLTSLREIDADKLARTEELGRALSFKDGIPVFRRTLQLFQDLAECDLGGIPFEQLSTLDRNAQDALKRFQSIKDFSLEKHGANPTQQRDALIQQLQDQWNTYWASAAPVISFTTRKGIDFDALQREARGVVAEQAEVLNDLKTERDKNLAEMRGALEKVRQAAAEAGVAQHAIHFQEEAEANRNQAWIWLGFAAAFAVSTIVYALVFLPPSVRVAAEVPTPRLVGVLVARIVVVSVLTSGIFWCARNFSALRHNFVVNRHRQNALSTFEAFAKAAEGDAETKNAVLLQATHSIFVPLTSGYSREDAAPPQSARLVEIFRGLADKTE